LLANLCRKLGSGDTPVPERSAKRRSADGRLVVSCGSVLLNRSQRGQECPRSQRYAYTTRVSRSPCHQPITALFAPGLASSGAVL